ncbi:MAG: hypothetical protein ACRDZ9_04715 [Acidimicrobiales bacterium]
MGSGRWGAGGGEVDSQHGVVTRRQVLAAGMTPAQVGRPPHLQRFPRGP